MKEQKLFSYVRQAIDNYNMINDGDKIAVGISGGKDSLTLLYALKKLQRFYPKSFDLIGITINLGFGIQDFHQIKNYCSNLDVDNILSKHKFQILFLTSEKNLIHVLYVQKCVKGL